MTQTCPQCAGEGQTIENPCRDCRGTGKARKTANLTVKIPPGIFEGATLRITGEGEAGGRGAPAGDLYVLVKVKPDPRFERLEDDLLVEQNLDISQAALGTVLEVPTMESANTKIKIPPGVQHGATFRIHDKGMPKLHGRGHGDLMVKIKVAVPKHLTDRQRELLEEFGRTLKDDGHGQPQTQSSGEGIFKKIFGKE